MGKHSGTQDPNDIQGPSGSGPHPTEKESQALADSFDRQYENNAARAEEKRNG